MRFKLIVAMAEEKRTNALMDAARNAGAKGSTVIRSAKGKGLDVTKTFLGLSLENTLDIRASEIMNCPIVRRISA